MSAGAKGTAYIKPETGDKIESSETLKILGFEFDRNPNPGKQIDRIISKFSARTWSLRYLKRSGMQTQDLIHVYITFIRPIAEYAAPSFQSMLTQEMINKLERQQARALKIIYGFHHSYRKTLEMSGLPTLQDRRIILTDKFALKLAASEKHKHLFPERPSAQRRARNGNVYTEFPATTQRLYNSPLYYMRRRLNYLNKDKALT